VKEKSTEGTAESRPVWESLEAFARQGVQRLLQQLLEEEVEHALGDAAAVSLNDTVGVTRLGGTGPHRPQGSPG